jgi:hypothetical protein
MLEMIPNFPQQFMARHTNWHTGAGPDGRTIPQGSVGSGAEFLDFHHDFITDVRTWYASQSGAIPSKMDAWAHFPQDLAAAHSPELADFEAQASNPANFTSEDSLGLFVEAEHNNVHGYIATQYGQPEFGSLHSCMYFMFYQWHGLIDTWRASWLVANKRAMLDLPKVIRDGVKRHPEIPPKSPKELVELPGIVLEGDPLFLVLQRLSKLETIVQRQAFIRGAKRPKVG